ncbi:hypothetical protein CPB86DRAFT_285334 [Serendipita vermifera]|nr:hypothetical protein CPB86DRAFT_285334 [Serendipita vermifera]
MSRIARPGEQSVAGALFQISTNLGTSFGLAITTIGQIRGMNAEARTMGIEIDTNATALEIPPNVLLRGYRDAQWTSFVFGVTALVLVVGFLHGIGIVGSQPEKQESDVEKA